MSSPPFLNSSLKHFSAVKYWTEALLCFSLIFKISNQFLPRKNLILYQTTASRIKDHAISLICKVKLKFSKIYLLFLAEQSKLDAFLTENLCTGWIHLSKSSIAVPVFFTNKKNSSLHIVQDYRNLNTIIVKNKYSLSLISEWNTLQNWVLTRVSTLSKLSLEISGKLYSTPTAVFLSLW